MEEELHKRKYETPCVRDMDQARSSILFLGILSDVVHTKNWLSRPQQNELATLAHFSAFPIVRTEVYAYCDTMTDEHIRKTCLKMLDKVQDMIRERHVSFATDDDWKEWFNTL